MFIFVVAKMILIKVGLDGDQCDCPELLGTVIGVTGAATNIDVATFLRWGSLEFLLCSGG